MPPDQNTKNIFVIFLITILSIFFVLPLLLSGNNLGIQDWDWFFGNFEAARKTMVEFRQLPLWNPYMCGGFSSLGNPESSLLSISFLLVLLFGTVIGLKLSVCVHYIIFALGLYFLARELKVGLLGGLMTAIVGAFSGVLSSAIGAGMVVFLSVAYVPIILLFFLRMTSKKNNFVVNGVITSLILSVIFYSGHHIMLVFIPTLISLSIFSAFQNKSLLPLLALAFVAIFSLLFSFPKLILSFDLFTSFKPPQHEFSGFSPLGIIYFILSRAQKYDKGIFLERRFFTYDVDENSLYIGLLPFLFGLVGLILYQKKYRIFVALLLLNLLLMFGERTNFGLWSLFKKFPFYSYFRVAQRFRFIFIIFFSLFAGLGFDNLTKSKYLRNFSWLFTLVIFCIYIDLLLFTDINFFSKTFIVKNTIKSVPNKRVSDNIFINHDNCQNCKKQETYKPWSNFYQNVLENKGSVFCSMPTLRHNIVGTENPKYIGEAYLTTPHIKPLKAQLWSPNMIYFNLPILSSDSRLILNQNYNAGWYAIVNSKYYRVKSYRGLLYINVERNTKNITFVYNPLVSWFIH